MWGKAKGPSEDLSISELEEAGIRAMREWDRGGVYRIADAILTKDRENVIGTFLSGFPKKDRSMDGSRAIWEKASSLAKTPDDMRSLYDLTVETVARFMRRVSEKKWVFDGMDTSKLSAVYFQRMRDLTDDPPVLNLDVVKAFERQFDHVDGMFVFMKMSLNTTMFFNHLILFASGPTETMDACNACIHCVDSILDKIKSKGIMMGTGHLLNERNFFQLLLRETETQTADLSKERMKIVDEFWKSRKGTDIPKLLHEAKKESGKMAPFTATDGDPEIRDERLREYVQNMIEMRD